MNCIWILLLLTCCGNNGCGCSNWNDGCNRCRRCGMGCARRSSCNDCDDRRTRESTCENVCEAACEAAREAVNETSDQDCGCRRSFPYTSYPILDNCD